MVVSCLVTQMYCVETAGRMDLPLGTGIYLGQCHNLLYGGGGNPTNRETLDGLTGPYYSTFVRNI